MSTKANKALFQKWVDEVLNAKDISDQSPQVAADYDGHFPDQPPIEGLEAFGNLTRGTSAPSPICRLLLKT